MVIEAAGSAIRLLDLMAKDIMDLGEQAGVRQRPTSAVRDPDHGIEIPDPSDVCTSYDCQKHETPLIFGCLLYTSPSPRD